MNILEVENASFAVGHVALLNHAAFQLDSGEKIGLIGRNGAGKSTFLKILAGVQKLDDGQVIIQNGLKIVYVPQEPLFDANISVFDAVSEGLGGLRDVLRRYHQISHALESSQDGALLKELNELQSQIETQEGWQFDAAISQTISELGLPEHTLIGNLSGGQKNAWRWHKPGCRSPIFCCSTSPPTTSISTPSSGWKTCSNNSAAAWW